MYGSQYPFYELHQSILGYQGSDLLRDVLSKWCDENSSEITWLDCFRRSTIQDWTLATDEDRCRLYAIFRVTSLLLLAFQSPKTGYDGYAPVISLEEFKEFHNSLGLDVFEPAEFHPFYCEVTSVEPHVDLEAPVTLQSVLWPAIMLGDLLLSRAGTSVSGGLKHVSKEIAESSVLHWTYRRRDRPCEDLSHGWGHNSQWRTQLRRDYCRNGAYHYNVDGRETLDGASTIDRDIPVATMCEIVRNRCAIVSDQTGEDQFPYEFSLTEIQPISGTSIVS